MTSLRVHIDRVAGSMRNRLVRDPLDGPTYHVLARTLAARARAGFVGSIEAARCAAEIAHALQDISYEGFVGLEYVRADDGLAIIPADLTRGVVS